MTPSEVAQYLQDHPDFLEQHPELLARMTVTQPTSGKVLPLADRQVMVLRDENKTYRAKLAELIQFGEENVAISDKMHRLAVALLPARDLDGLLAAFYYNLREDFAVPHTAIRLWRQGDGHGESHQETGARPELGAVSAEIKEYASGLAHPYCGPSASVEAAAWFGDAASHVRSVAHVPLYEPGPGGAGAAATMAQGTGQCVGVLALGSEEVLRFYPDMGTLFLKRLGDLLAAGLLRHL